MLAQNLEAAIERAMAYAYQRRHEFATIEHLALALLDDFEICDLIISHDISISKLKKQLINFLDKDVPSIPQGQSVQTLPSYGLQRLVQETASHMQGAGKDEISCAHVLVEIYNVEDCHAAYFFSKAGLTQIDVMVFLSNEDEEDDSFDDEDEMADADQNHEDNVLATYTENLVQKAKNGEVDALIGREKEMERIIHILLRRKKNNPILVGEAGVGKTAIIEGLAQQIAAGKIPQFLNDTQVYSLDMAALVAGTRFRGDFENRLKALIKALQAQPGAILAIDEIHTIVGAGSTQGSSMDAGNLLKPLLSSGKIRCIGSTSYREYREHFEKDHGLARRFQRVDVAEPSQEDSLAILRGCKKEYEDFHGVKFADDALVKAVALSIRFLPDRHLPDKAIDIIDEAAAALKMKTKGKTQAIVTEKMVEETIAIMAKIPAQQLNSDDKISIASLEDTLRKVVFGQDAALLEVVNAIKLSRAGLREKEKTIGAFLFSGPTGVGKTEVAKQLAKSMGINFIRLDMSEYMEKHSVSRLIGAPPGYVGFEQGGILTDAVFKTPHAVVLLDEIEKAHFDIFNVLLQIMDYGRLTDANGRTSDFRHVILIMTSNVGARELSQRRIGFGDAENVGADEQKFRQIFSPEFRNRLDARIKFLALSPGAMTQIVDKFFTELVGQVSEKGVSLEMSDKAKSYLATAGYDRAMGARPLSRLIQEQVKKPLAESILFGELQNGGTALIDFHDTSSSQKIVIKCTAMKKKQRNKMPA